MSITLLSFSIRSTRIIWLVQISKEMFTHDENGDLYFDKFLYKFVDPLVDRWKSMGVSHSLTTIFFSRSVRINPKSSTFLGSDYHNLWTESYEVIHLKVLLSLAINLDFLHLL